MRNQEKMDMVTVERRWLQMSHELHFCPICKLPSLHSPVHQSCYVKSLEELLREIQAELTQNPQRISLGLSQEILDGDFGIHVRKINGSPN